MNELSVFHYHEILDRINTVQILLAESVCEHPVYNTDKKLTKHLDEAVKQLGKAYQRAGKLRFAFKETK
jgi:hypothetical protein